MSDAADEDYSDDEPTVKRSEQQKRKILSFLQKASLSELQTVETISALKANLIIAARPFTSLNDFKNKERIQILENLF